MRSRFVLPFPRIMLHKSDINERTGKGVFFGVFPWTPYREQHRWGDAQCDYHHGHTSAFERQIFCKTVALAAAAVYYLPKSAIVIIAHCILDQMPFFFFLGKHLISKYKQYVQSESE